jgi:tetratricopeptide (TPR) repeat protein
LDLAAFPKTLRRLAEHHNYAALREACSSEDSGEPGVQVLLALASAGLGEQAAARCILASLDPTRLDISIRVDLAAVYIALDEPEEAVAILEFASREATPQAGSDHPLLLARLGWCRLRQGRLDEALALYERSLALEPRIAVYHNLLRLFRDSGRFDEMAACLDQAWRYWSEEQEHWSRQQRQAHSQQLRDLQLDLLLNQGRIAAAESWIERERDTLSDEDWCALLCGFAQRLATSDHHALAEQCLRQGLDRYPEQPILFAQLAELAHLQGRPIQSMALLRRAITLTNAQGKPSERLWAQLSVMASQFNPTLAREAALHAQEELAGHSGQGSLSGDELAERRLHVQLALAGVEAREQDYHAAEDRYRSILEHRPDAIPALHGLGQLYMQVGRIDEAVALYERVKAIDPARGHGALINAHRFPEDDDTLQRLERLARTVGVEGPVRIGLLFQLAAAWEKRSEFEKAFALVNEANSASRRLLRYNPKDNRQRCARVRHAFPRVLYERRPGCGHESTLPVFVVGMPRSGTTLVEQIIAGHSRIHGAGELGTIPRVIAGLERWERRIGSGRRYPDCVDDLDPQVSRGLAENVLKELRATLPTPITWWTSYPTTSRTSA